ncbi:hypothetical protein [Brevibacillus borstelensis]|uniref:hypothetical protein n=1 Tax=Brevibacillus borstelensis TaxID=45462 RepID=UPI002E2213D4|nr:hypothetical protein [Brevibacillus borstelensis]
MLNIKPISEETKKSLSTIYNICEPEEFSSPFELAESVFNKCFHLIPYDIRDFIKLDKSDLILHMVMNAYIFQLTETEGHVNLSHALIERFYRYFELAIANEKAYNLFGNKGKDILRATRKHISNFITHWDLPTSGKDSRIIPVFLVPLIMFQATHFDAHKVLKSYKDSQHSWTYLKDIKELSEFLHLNFYQNFKQLLDHFPGFNEIIHFFENNQISYQPLLVRILFEREYQLGLASKIATLTIYHSKEIQNRLHRLLSILAMLPNVSGRLFYLPFILYKSLSAHFLRDLPGGENIVLESDQEKLIRIEAICKDLIGFALITIPVMESYFLYFWKRKNMKLDKNVTEDLNSMISKKYFGEDRNISEDTIIKGPTNKIIGSRIDGVWELPELPFKYFSEILKMLNSVTFIKNQYTLNNIHLNPHQFLDKYGFDTFSLIILDEHNTQELIESVSDVVQDNFLDFLFKS